MKSEGRSQKGSMHEPRATIGPIAIAVLAAALFGAALSCAAAQDPFPNQPGALSANEIQAAAAAMKSALRGAAELPLFASGRRSGGHMMPSYALFASPLPDFSERVKVRRQVICNYWSNGSVWRCSEPHDQFRMTANGMEHAFSHQIAGGSGDRRAVVDAVDFIYSRCWNDQFTAIGGKPFTPSPDSDFVSTVLDDGRGYTVITGPLSDGNSYRLEKTDRSGDDCGFRIHHVRLLKAGVILPESYAKEAAAQAEKDDAAWREQMLARERELARATPLAASPEGTRVEEWIAMIFFFIAMIFSGLAVDTWPLRRSDPWGAARRAGMFATLCTVAAIFSAALVPMTVNIRIDLLADAVVVLGAWVAFVSLAIYAAAGGRKDQGGRQEDDS